VNSTQSQAAASQRYRFDVTGASRGFDAGWPKLIRRFEPEISAQSAGLVGE
jgi:hypothetical protein